jgi:hypothetical protein
MKFSKQPPPPREDRIQEELESLYRRSAVVENLIEAMEAYVRTHQAPRLKREKAA